MSSNKNMPPPLAAVNDFWNRSITYKAEQGKDVWQTPAETIALGTGDCEDYAIGKYFTLRALGFLGIPMSVWTLKLEGAGAHCLLTVNGWALDNFAKDIVSMTQRVDVTAIVRSSTKDKPDDPRFAAMLARLASDEDSSEILKFIPNPLSN